MTIRAVIFDLDGVLVDAREWHYESLNNALGLFGYEIDRFDHLTRFDGLPTRDKLEQLTVTDGLPHGLHRIVSALKQNFTLQTITLECFPTFHTEYALSRLRREGYRLAVCSNAVRDSVDLMLERSGLNPYLEFSLSNADCTRSKPDPDIYLRALERLEVQPEEALVLEDNHYGIEAARAAGAHVLQVFELTDVTYENIRRRIDEVEGVSA